MNKIKKTIVGFVGIAMALSLVAVSPASAAVDFSTMSTADLQALFAQLQSKLGSAQAPAMTAPTFTRSLTVGSVGADVTALQNWLISKGYSIPAGATGTFGAQTKAAVAAYQLAKGITPAAGYFGPVTQARVTADSSVVVVPGNTGNTNTGTLAGTDGSISDVNALSQYSNEEIGEGQNDVKVLGFEVETSNDGDIALKSLKLSFDPSGNASSDSDHLDDYIEGVTVWQGSTKIGSAKVSEFSKDSSDVYTKTITLSNSVVKADKTEKFYVSVDGANTFDSGDIDSDSWSVDVENIRFEDGSGVVTTDTDSGDINNLNVAMDFVTFSTSANTELKISTDSATPEAGIVIIDDVSNTDDVVLLKGKIKVDGTSDVLVDEFPVTLTTVGGATVSAVTGSLKLTINSEEYTESVSVAATTGTVTFDNLDLTLDAGKTYSFTVSADINDIDAGNLDEGDTLKAEVTATNRNYIDVENEEGDQLDDSSEKSGTATGESQEFRTSGVQLALVSSSSSVAAGTSTNDDQGTFTIKFKVKAIGDNVYVSSLADAQLSGNTSGKTTVLVDRAGTATVGGVSTVIANNTDTTLTSVGNYLIEEGSEETFTLTTTVQLPAAGAAGLYRAVLGGVRWSTTDVAPVASSYTSNLDSFKTDYVGLN